MAIKSTSWGRISLTMLPLPSRTSHAKVSAGTLMKYGGITAVSRNVLSTTPFPASSITHRITWDEGKPRDRRGFKRCPQHNDVGQIVANAQIVSRCFHFATIFWCDTGRGPMDRRPRQPLDLRPFRVGKSSLAHADAVLDRMVHNAHRVDLNGQSMRRTRKLARKS